MILRQVNPFKLKKHKRLGCFGGIYFLFNKGKLVYIGQSKCIVHRLGFHEADTDKIKNWDSYAFVKTNVARKKLLKIENKLIQHYKPKYNKTK